MNEKQLSTCIAGAAVLNDISDDPNIDRVTVVTEATHRDDLECEKPVGGEAAEEGDPSFLEEAADLRELSAQYQLTVRRQSPTNIDERLGALAGARSSTSAELLREVHHADPAAADRLSRAVTSFPKPGESFLGFRLIGVLGRGGFGRVYLAEQGELANRPVALKIAADITGESQTLAQLQHTNIVPIYSRHRADPFQAVCMPYFGGTTFADILKHLDNGESLPNSGKHLISTLNDRKASTVMPLSSHSFIFSDPLLRERDGAFELPAELPAPPDSTLAAKSFEALSYVDSILWMFARLADGLAHAHERGILHRDLKPANILLTDDGVPMLLDFNLSEDVKVHGGAAAATIGGTLPYMAPEHLEAFCNRSKQVDARSDIFSLGVILYELLTGRPPFPSCQGCSAETIRKMIDDRKRIVPQPRLFNPAVSPAVESIVQHCLKADPGKRYQSAHDLQIDLERQLHNRPLRFAPEPSMSERVQKWARRHPRLASTSTIGCLAAVLVIFLGTAIVLRDRRLAQFEAAQTFNSFQEKARTAEFKLLSRHAEKDQLASGIENCLGALALYQIMNNADWRKQSAVSQLSPYEQAQLDKQAGQLLFLLAKATSLYAQYYAPASEREEGFKNALAYNLSAASCFGTGTPPKALLEQRADLANLLGRKEEAGKLAELSKQTPAESPRDLYLIAHRQTIEGKFREALESLRKTTQEEPGNFAAWFVRGNCYYELLQDAQAAACFNACVVLQPDFPWAWFDRGLAHLRMRNYRQAWDDFDRVLRLEPDLSDALIARARAKEGLGRFSEAVDDYTKALHADKPSTRIYFLRSQARAHGGDAAGAQKDFEKGLVWEPSDEAGWIARGLAKQNTDVAGALADFEQALRLNPCSFEGLQNKAAALDRLGRAEESLAVIEQTVRLYPESSLALCGRGVLLARKKLHSAAIADAEAALIVDPSPSTFYQAACVYSLLSEKNPTNRLQALHLLSTALHGGYGLDILDTDTDLDLLRALPEFKQITSAAKVLHTSSIKHGQ
jgi:eukaryotic-like serine/threonine-protein kinase